MTFYPKEWNSWFEKNPYGNYWWVHIQEEVMPDIFGNRAILVSTLNYMSFRYHIGSYETRPFASAVAVLDVHGDPVFEITDDEGEFVGRVVGAGNRDALIAGMYDRLMGV